MITRMHILLENGADNGPLAMFEAKRFCCGGQGYTDLRPGKYQLIADFGRKEWKILQVGAARTGPIRFSVDLEGPDPFKLGYATPVELEISAVVTRDSYVADPFLEPLNDIGANAFRDDDDYVDSGIEGGEFDVFGATFAIRYENGERFVLTNHVRWSDLVDQVKGGASVYTFYQLKPPMKERILPRVFDKNSAPNITAMINDIVEAIPGALAMQQIGRVLLDQVQVGPRPLGRGPKGLVSPKPMRMRQVPKQRLTPVNGTVNVGGGPKDGVGCTNLNPIVPGTGGPKSGQIPNHVAAGFEDMGDIFTFGSVTNVKSSRLPFGTVNWAQSSRAAYSVMAPGGRLHLNVWTQTQAEVDQIIRALTDAGFRDVQNVTKAVGAGTLITGVK